MIDVLAFRKIVDATPDNISTLQSDLKGLYEYVGLAPNTAYTSKAVSDELYNKIRASFVTERTLVWGHCRQLENELIWEHVLEGVSLEPSLAVLGCIRDAMLQPSTGLVSDDWNSAIGAAYDFIRMHPQGNIHTLIHGRQFATSHAALRLRQRGFILNVKNGHAVIEQREEERLVFEIEELVKVIGGINVATLIFQSVSHLYDTQQERYHLVRRVGNMPTPFESLPPFGYLLLLAAKHPASPRHRGNINLNWVELLKLSTDYASLFDVQPHSQYELMFKDAASLIPFLQEIALYDTLFVFQQIRPRDAIKISYGVLDWLDIDRKYDGGWSIKEVLTIAEKMLDIGRFQHKPSLIKIDTFKGSGLNPKLISKILQRVFSHSLPGANQGYSEPNGSVRPDYSQRPLLSLGAGNYYLLNSSACAPAVIESLFISLRPFHKKFDEDMGTGIERFLRQELNKKGVIFCEGDYNAKGIHGQCDLVIETSDTIIFLEIKKKPLTRNARVGLDIAIVLDLMNSLLKAQIQAGGHEIELRKAECINLIDHNGEPKRISLNGRAIERVAVSLFDYGGFQDRMFLKHFLEISLNIKYSSADPQFQKKLDDLNVMIDELRNQTIYLNSLPNKSNQPFFHCWFLSVPQLLIALDSVNNNEDFKASLWKTRTMVTGSQDFYFDHAQMKRISAS